MRYLALVLVIVVAACGGDDSPSSPSVTSGIPTPTDEQALYIESDVADVYPGVPEGKAADWARGVCQRQRSGASDGELETYIIPKFAGGGRPDPTAEQAQAILAAIRASGYCP